MSFLQTPVHQHKKGWTTAIFDPNGKQIFSAGADGKVKVLRDLNDTSPMEHVIGEKINSVLYRNDTLILATEGTFVHVIQVEDGLPEGMATRFTAEVNHVALNKDGSKLAACSSDFLIKVVNFSSLDEREFVLKGHTGGVLSVAFDPLDILLASASCDGTVRIWRLDEKSEIKSLRCLSPSNDPTFALSLCRLCWEYSSGKFLAVPVDKEICLYERNTWEILCYLTCPTISGAVIVCISSFDGSLLAGGTEDGWIVIWRVHDRHALFRLRDPSHSAICSLAWHSQQDSLILSANRNGSLSLIRLPDHSSADNDALSPAALEALMGCEEDGDTDQLLRAAAAQAESSRLINEDEAAKLLELPGSDNDDADSIDLSRIKSGYLDMDDEDDDVADTVPKVDPSTQQVGKNVSEANMPGTMPTSVAPQQRVQRPFQSGSMPLGFRERFMVWNRVGLVVQYRGTTDAEDEDADDIEAADGGSIEVEFHDTSVHHSLRLSNKIGYTMADLSLTALILASPGSNDVNLADELDAGAQLDPSDLSQIAVLPLDTSTTGDSSSSEWTVRLPAGEACDAVCLVPHEDPDERGYAVVATSKRFIRIFSQPSPSISLLRPSAGLHLFQVTKLGLPPISVTGCCVVTMASHPSLPILGVVVSTLTGDLLWRLYYLGGSVLGNERTSVPNWLNGTLSMWQALPLSPDPYMSASTSAHASARLTWFGFSDLGGLYTHDSSGTVRRLIHGRKGKYTEHHWIPVCDTHSALKPSNRLSDTYFMVGVLESTETLTSESTSSTDDGFGQLQTLYCKASKWPRVFPRPVISNLPFRLPLCSLGTDQGNLEETYLRFLVSEDWPIWGPNLGVAQADEREILQTVSSKCLTKRKGVLLRLFALSAKLESDWASLAVARLMPDAATVQLAIRYAGRLRRQHLAQRLAGIALEKERTAIPVVESSSSGDEETSEDLQSPYITSKHSKYSSDSRYIESDSVVPRRMGHRHPSGARDEQDMTNVSLVSSATDDTHEEGHLSGLPLLESEPISQSVLSSNTPSSVGTRNPFREAKSAVNPQSSVKSSLSAARGRGSEVLDYWEPKSGHQPDSNPLKTAQSKAGVRSGRKRAAPGPTNEQPRKRQSKVAKSAQPQADEKLNDDAPTDFMEWFDDHREELEEQYPDESVEDLIRKARQEFQKLKSKCPTALGTDDDLNEKENEPLSRTSSEAKLVAPKVKKHSFSDSASKRLASFKFDQNATD